MNGEAKCRLPSLNCSMERLTMEFLKISSKSSPSSIAGAIAGMIKDGMPVEMQSVGAGAVNQAVKAMAIARGFLAPVGIEISCIPSFADVVVEGKKITAIRFVVEPRYQRGTVLMEDEPYADYLIGSAPLGSTPLGSAPLGSTPAGSFKL